MKVLFGVDIESVKRIHGLLFDVNFSDYTGVLLSVFSSGEIVYCSGKKFAERHFTVRYAAKEAFFKALGTGLRGEFTLADVSIVHDRKGKPKMLYTERIARELSQRNLKTIEVSLSHTSEFGLAFVSIYG